MEGINDEYIEQYFKGQLGDSEKRDFEVKLEQNSDLRNYVTTHLAVINGIKLHAKEKLKEEFSDWEKENNNQNRFKSKNKNSFFVISAIAASITLLFVIGFLLYTKTPDNNQLADSYFIPYPNYITSINRNETTLNDLKKEGMYFYQSKKYKEAIEVFDKYLSATPNDHSIIFYKGCAHLAVEETLKAIPLFEKVIDNKENEFSDVASWYLGLAFLKNNDKEDAIVQLKLIKPENEFYQQSITLLKVLEE